MPVRRSAGTGIFFFPDRYCPVIERGSAMRSSTLPAATISPPWMPAPGPTSDDVIRRAHRVLIVLHHEHGVAEVAQMAQRVEQLVVVALVQSDGRLVENVEHAHQARADLRREADALASRRRRAWMPREREEHQNSGGPTGLRGSLSRDADLA